MSKYIFIAVFYILSGVIIRVMNVKFPGAHDSGIGLGLLAVILFKVAVLVFIIMNIYKYVHSKDNSFLIIGGIHLLVLVFSGSFVNWVINGF